MFACFWPPMQYNFIMNRALCNITHHKLTNTQYINVVDVASGSLSLSLSLSLTPPHTRARAIAHTHTHNDANVIDAALGSF